MPYEYLWGRADHTFVYAIDSKDEHHNCICYGETHVPGSTDIPVVTIDCNNMQVVSGMINLSPELEPVYNSFWRGHCGLLYGAQGVCHTMTNRILLAAGGLAIPLNMGIKGYDMSYIIYGFYGDNTNVMSRLLRANTIATEWLWASNAEQLPVFDPVVFDEYMPKLASRIADLKDAAMQQFLRMELYGVSTPENRLVTLYQQRLLDGKSDALQTDRRLRALINQLNLFITEKEEIFVDYKEDVPVDQEREIERLHKLNTAFVLMNRAMGEILHYDYKKLFGDEFDKGFILYEYFK